MTARVHTLLKLAKPFWWLAALAGLALLIVGVYSYGQTMEVYRSRVTLIVLPEQLDQRPKDDFRQIRFIADLRDTFTLVFGSEEIHAAAAESVGLSEREAALYTVESRLVRGTNIIQVFVVGPDPDIASHLLDALVNRGNQQIQELYQIYEVYPLQEVSLPTAAFRSNNMWLYISIVGVGAVVGSGVLALYGDYTRRLVAWGRATLTRYSAPIFGAAALIGGAALAAAAVYLDMALLILAGIIAAYGLVILIQRMEVGLAALVFIISTHLSFVLINYHGAPSVMKAFVPLLLLLVVARWLILGETPRGWVEPVLIMGAYILVSAFSLTYAADFNVAYERLTDLIKDALIAVALIMILRDEGGLRLVAWSFIGAGIFLGTISVIQYVTGSFGNIYGGFALTANALIVGETNDYRTAGPFGSANAYGNVTLIFIAFALDRFLHAPRLMLRGLAGVGLAVGVLSIMFTYSRGAFLGMVIIAAITLLAHNPRPRSLLPLALAGVLMLTFAPANYFDRLATLVGVAQIFQDDQPEDVSFRGRASENQVGVQVFLDHPLMGVGIANYETFYQEYAIPLGLESRRTDRAAHNRYLEVAAEQGMLGLTVYLGMLTYATGQVLQARKRLSEAGHDARYLVTAVGVALMGHLFVLIFTHDSHDRFFWMLLGLALATRQVALNAVPRRQPVLRRAKA